MAFADDLTLKDRNSAAHTFSRTKSLPDKSTWIDQATTASEPRTLSIAHRREPIKDNPGKYRDRHTVSFEYTKLDPTTGVPYTMNLNASIVMPLVGPLVRNDLDDLRTMLYEATAGIIGTTANVDKLMRNEL